MTRRPFANIQGGGRHLTERDFDAQERTREIRDRESRRWANRMTRKGPDVTAVLYRCGCVAGVKDTAGEAQAWVDRLLSVDDEGRWDGATLVPARSDVPDSRMRVYRRPDGAELPLYTLDHRGSH